MNYVIKSSFHGKIAEIPGISVDNFENARENKARAYFLSHCHTDHTKGLVYNNCNLVETLCSTKAFIYMSELTAAVINYDTDDKVQEYVKILQPGTNSITLPAVPEKNLEELCINVIMIPAGHSFGSVMFIFQTTTKTVLFTGDFRIRNNDVPKYAHFHNKSGDPIKIDVMYVDTTFLADKFEHFPKRSEGIEETVQIIKDWLDEDVNNRISLHTSAKFGYESIFNEIHEKLGEKVLVENIRWEFYSSLPKNEVPSVTNNGETAKIHVCRNLSEWGDHVKCHTSLTCEETENKNFLYLYFSAMKWDGFNVEDQVVNKISDKRIDICFATHCSRSELVFFVKYFDPAKVVGFPNEYREKPQKRDFGEEFVNTPKKRKVASPGPKVLEDRKADKELTKKMLGF